MDSSTNLTGVHTFSVIVIVLIKTNEDKVNSKRIAFLQSWMQETCALMLPSYLCWELHSGSTKWAN